jgi:hypothetical protein
VAAAAAEARRRHSLLPGGRDDPDRVAGLPFGPADGGLGVTALQWAARAGFGGYALDFQSANLVAARFWPAVGFCPVLPSVGRRTA